MRKLLHPVCTGFFRLTVLMFLYSVLLSNVQTAAAQGCGCTNCPQFMPDNFVGDFLINVSGADNPTLGQNGQGVCGVTMHLNHEYIGDLTITLTSPSGQSVTLVGPEGFWGPTDGDDWNISFVPCGDMANPDPGFSAQWNNNQAWGLNNSYSGSYYPSNGCLENFNSGPVDGTWTLTVVDGQAIDVGNFFDYQIIFCDPSGIMCFSCAAQAGELPQPNVTACQGSTNLNLDLPPTYTAPFVAPPAADYGYTYVVSNQAGVILAYEPGPDLTAYDPGVYNVCGLSYYLMQEGDIPQPDGSLTINQLNTQLSGNQPPFCGDLTSNCVQVTVSTNPPDEEEDAEICAPACYSFHGQSYCQSGTYVRNLTTPQGCSYVATLNLIVHQPVTNNLVEVVCLGECATTPGFEDRCSQGTYQEVYQTEFGCDSFVILNLQVLNVKAVATPQGSINCNTPSIQIIGAGSTTGANVTYLWTASNGGHIVGSNNNINVLVDEGGDYQLRVCRSGGGAFCCDSVEVTVLDNSMSPAPPASVTGPASLCPGESATFTAAPVTGATSYSWTVPPGVTIVGNSSGLSIDVMWSTIASGQVCVSSVNNCGTSAPVCTNVSITPAPAPGAPQGNTVLCAGAQEPYSIAAVANATGYNWTVTGGTIASGQGTTNVIVQWGGGPSGQLCVNATSACGTSQDVCTNVTLNTPPAAPQINGPAGSCPGNTSTYSITPIAGASTYNWSVTGGTISSGQGTNTIQVQWDANAASGTVCANAANTCGASTDNCLNVSLSVPAAGQITPLCDGTNTSYTISFPIAGGTAPYTISGGSITGGVFTSDPIASGQSYTFQIVDSLLCTSVNISGSYNCACATNAGNMNLTPLTACSDQTVTATHQGGQQLDANDITAYIMHNSPGTSIGLPVIAQNTTGVFGYIPGMAFGQTYYISFVVGNNSGGFPDLSDPCLSVSQGQPVVFYEYPVANAGLDMDTCGLSLVLNAQASIGIGQWTVLSAPAGDTLHITSLQNPNSAASADHYGVYTLSWGLDNQGCMDVDTVVLDFNSTPGISGLMHACDGANENYTVSFDVTGGTPSYTVNGSPAGSISNGVFSAGPIINGGTYSYQIADSAGCVSAPLSGSYSCNCETDAGQMDLNPLSTCEGGTIHAVYQGGAALDANDTFAYVLHTLPGTMLGVIYAQNATGDFTFQPGMSFGTTYYVSYVVGNNLAGALDLNDPCLAVAPGQPVIFYQNPVANAGLDQSTCGTLLNLDGNLPANSSGQWSIVSTPAGGGLVLDDPQSPFSGATAQGFGVYTLQWTISQNGCLGTDQVDLHFNDSPILSDLQRICDSGNENFTVVISISGGTSPYSVNGQNISGNTFTSNAFPNGQSYSFNINDANGCSMPQINGAYSCNCATDAGSMPANLITVCEGLPISVTGNNDVGLDGNDITAYVLHSGAGPALGVIYGENTTGVFDFNPAQMIFGSTYYVSRVAGNPLNGMPDPADPCFSVAPGQPVQWLQNPTPNAGPDLNTCGTSIDLHGSGSTFPGQWSLGSGPGTATFMQADDPASGVSVTAEGAYVFRWTENNASCTGFDEVAVDFNPIPQVVGVDETCNPTNTEFTVAFNAAGGVAPYTVSGLTGSFSGVQFLSDPLPNNSTYTFVLFDANGCESPAVSGAHNCACATDAGSMQTTPLVFCANEPAVAVWNNDGNTDANDIVRFILHDTPGASVGTVFATAAQPTFNFGGTLQFGVTYYISAIAGNAILGNVDLNDPCLSVTPGTPVQWKPVPTAEISGDATLCMGESAILSFSGTGTYPLTLEYNTGSGIQSITLTGPQSVTLPVTPDLTTTYQLTQVQDGSLPACTASLTDAAIVTVNQPVEAGLAGQPLSFCAGAGSLVKLSDLLTGEQAGGQWTETSQVPSQNGAFNATTGTFQAQSQAAGVYTFVYHLSATAPCPDDEATVSVIIHPSPVAVAGQDAEINCNTLAIDLGAPGSALNQYRWILNGDTIANEAAILAKEGGLYTLLVTTPDGCTATDQVTVTEDKEIPIADAVSKKDIRCNGEHNGAISVDAVQSTHTPVLYSLNGGPFVSSPLFSGLAAGDYVVTMQDTKGCENTTDTLSIDEPPVLTADLGADLKVDLADSAHLTLQTSLPWNTLQSILWEPLLDSTAAGKPYQDFLPLHSWEVKVSITDSSGCTASDQLLLRVAKPRNIYIPNIFKPDGDFNLLYPFGGRDVDRIESFRIYDRWGELVFEALDFAPNDPTKGWDGRIKGASVTPAVFVYTATVRFIDKEKVLFKGDVTVLR